MGVSKNIFHLCRLVWDVEKENSNNSQQVSARNRSGAPAALSFSRHTDMWSSRILERRDAFRVCASQEPPPAPPPSLPL